MPAHTTYGEQLKQPNICDAVCRFFGREEWCDVGGPNPSPSDVTVMVRYCDGNFSRCSRYKMLAERWSGMNADALPKIGDGVERFLPRPSIESASTCEVARGVLQHELRTPLAAILTSAEILRDNPDRDAETRAKFVNVICEESKRLKETVENLFDGLGEGVEPESADPVTLKGTTDSSGSNNYFSSRSKTMSSKTNKGWSVVLAGTGINLALGILYTWSIFKGSIKESIETGGSFNWDLSSINDPYAVCCLVFAFAMIIAGRVQDRFGPRLTALVGGLLVGAGFIVISQTTSYLAWVGGFGVLAGLGIGFGYSAATPPALKWFPPAKTGLIAGVVVSGFGLASVYIAPLAKYMLGVYGIQQSMLFFGIAFTAVVGVLSMLLTNPPAGFIPEGTITTGSKSSNAPTPGQIDFKPSQLFKTSSFYTLWTAFFVGSGAGLMVIGSVAGMAKKSLGEAAFIAVALMAVGNAGGRIVAGILSDKIGRAKTLLVMKVFQATLRFAAIPIVGAQNPSGALLVALAAGIGFCYGTNLSLFPSFAKDFWGLRNFGTNYGILFSAWGVGGLVWGRVSQMLQASTGSYDLSFITAGVLLLLGAGMTLTLRDKKAKTIATEVREEERIAEAA